MVQNPPSSLNFLKAKGKWYVYVTIPPELRTAFKGQTQLRRSTGTSDKAIAKTREHGLAAEIYAEFDKARTELNPLKDALEALSDAMGAGKPTYFPDAYKDPETLAQMRDEARGMVAALRYGPAPADFEEAVLLDSTMRRAEPLLERVEAEHEVASGTAPSSEKLSELAKEFLSVHPFTKEKTKDAAKRAIDHFIEFSGDLVVSKIVKKHAYDFASGQSSKLAEKTIGNRLTFVSQCLTYAERKGKIAANPFKGLTLGGYGRKKEGAKKVSTALMNLRGRELKGVDPADIMLSCNKSKWHDQDERPKGLFSQGSKLSLCNFLPKTTRGTNKYRHCSHALYLNDLRLNPAEKEWLGWTKEQEDQWALSELLQWVMRSRLREGDYVSLYLASPRMKALLEDFLNNKKEDEAVTLLAA